MPFSLNIPGMDGSSIDIPLEVGEILFVLGANGTGKSALLQRLYAAHHTNALRVSAHRQTWLAADGITLSPAHRRQTGANIHTSDTNPQSRWIDHYAGDRTNIIIYDLLNAHNVRARRIAEAVDSHDMSRAQTLAGEQRPPITLINDILRLSNLPIVLSIADDEKIFASKSGSAPYSIAELSDGERNALLIAATVLTAKGESLILVDEPERHLHRSIMAPLLTLTFHTRPDLAFVVSTHDVSLAIGDANARVLLLRGCDSTLSKWESDLLPERGEVDDDIRRDILGGRRKLLFVEGKEHSLDKPLYAILFPQASVTAKSTCKDVERAVSAIRSVETFHWLSAFGIVDNDGRSSDDIMKLKATGVYATPYFSVESVYYHPQIQQRVVERHARVTGEDVAERLASARTAALAAIQPHAERLAKDAASRAVRNSFLSQMPTPAMIRAGEDVNFVIKVASVIAEEARRLAAAIQEGDVDEIVARYPIRETPMLDQIANALGFQRRTQYESAVRALLMDDVATLNMVRGWFGALAEDMGTQGV
ncbi:MAG: AAA family ATPase [Nitrospiraceae bacterium]|nr:AAA family ATPase [Nitrospiraceae bacterium]